MERHLSDEMALDVVESGPREQTRAHVAACAECGQKIEDLRTALHAVRGAAAPEPPPEYFARLGREIGRRIDSEPSAAGWRAWLWVPALAVAGAAALYLAVLPPAQSGPGADPTLPAWTATSADEDIVMTALVGLEPTAEDVAVATGQGGIANEVAGLSEDESVAVAGALQTAIRSGAL
jgi:hypothetical protein